MDKIETTLNDVTIVVVTYNSAHCIERLSMGLVNAPHIIVVDNGSEDDFAATCARFLPQANVLALPQNLGFGAANNRALNRVATPYALLLNPDCEMSETAIVELLAQAQLYPQAAMLAPHIVGANDKLTLNYGWVKHAWKSKGVADGACCVGYVTGAVMLLNMSVTKPLGFFDERFFLYYEDDDLCLKYFNALRAVIVVPSVKVFHASRGSVRTKHKYRQEYWRGYHHAQSKLLITEKYQSATAAQKLRFKKTAQAVFAVLGCVLILNLKMVARMAGRVRGMLNYRRLNP